MFEPYLILHKVRGEPAFDIAELLCGGNGDEPCQPNCGLWDGEICECKAADWWIIPTSGHRAYPAHVWKLDAIDKGELIRIIGYLYDPGKVTAETPWPSWPDHYAASASRAKLAAAAGDILSLMGINKKLPEVVRRRRAE